MDSAGYFSVVIKSLAAWVDASAEENPDIVVFSADNFTVSVMRSSLVLEIYTL